MPESSGWFYEHFPEPLVGFESKLKGEKYLNEKGDFHIPLTGENNAVILIDSGFNVAAVNRFKKRHKIIEIFTIVWFQENRLVEHQILQQIGGDPSLYWNFSQLGPYVAVLRFKSLDYALLFKLTYGGNVPAIFLDLAKY